jgi:double-stranded uracil-DNA glycosylase
MRSNPRPGPIGGPGLSVLFVGINPSLRSAEVGHHFARPGNRFWPTLYAAGFTPRRLAPEEDGLLPSFGLGVTNIVARPTRAASELTVAELRQGAVELEATVQAWAPRLVAVVGVVAYRHAFGRPRAAMGLQQERLGGRPVWILPNPSGLNAHYKPADFARLYGEARRYAASLGQAAASSSATSTRTRSRISSRTARTSARGRSAGSGRSQSI